MAAHDAPAMTLQFLSDLKHSIMVADHLVQSHRRSCSGDLHYPRQRAYNVAYVAIQWHSQRIRDASAGAEVGEAVVRLHQ